MPLVNEEWSAYTFERGTSAHRSFLVAQAANPTAAINATGLTVNTRHPIDPRLRIRQDGFSLQNAGGPTTWRVGVDYGFPETGAYEIGTDPLTAEPVFNFEIGLTSEPVDHDLAGNPIINAAGDPFSPEPNAEVKSGFFVFSRYEPTFNLDLAIKYTGAVNSKAIKLFKYGTVKPQMSQVASIKPMTNIKESADYILVEYRLEVRTPILTNRKEYSPFSTKERNRGNTGFYMNGTVRTRGNFTDSRGNQISDVDLKPDGTPIDSSIMVEAQKPFPNPKQLTYDDAQVKGPAIVENKDNAGNSVFFLYYQNNPVLDFRGLGIFN